MITLRSPDFSVNGSGRGTIVAYADGQPIWERYRANWSTHKAIPEEAEDLAVAAGITPDQARSLLSKFILKARIASDAGGDEEELEKTEMTARLPGLVDVVLTEQGSPAFLFLGESTLETTTQVIKDGVRYVPPSLEHFPYLLPREPEVRAAYRGDDDLALLRDLKVWHQRASKLRPQHYIIVCLFDFHTYISEKFDYSPYLLFHSKDTERGKSRQGNSVAWVAYRGFVTETLQEANLFRWADALGCTIFFDVRDLWRKAEKRGSDDLLLGRFQRTGPQVSRVLDPQAGAFRDMRYFDVYGPTIMASNEDVDDLLRSRSIPITPPESAGKYPNIRPEDGLPLRERLVAFRARHLNDALPDVEKPVIGRLGDILQPLAQVAAMLGGSIAGELSEIARSLYAERMQERSESRDARLLEAISKAPREFKDTQALISVHTVTLAFNESVPEKQHVSEETIGRRLSALGFNRHARLSDGGRARVYEPDLDAALQRKFGLSDFPENNPYQEPSEPANRQDVAQAEANQGPLSAGRFSDGSENRHDSSGEPSKTVRPENKHWLDTESASADSSDGSDSSREPPRRGKTAPPPSAPIWKERL